MAEKKAAAFSLILQVFLGLALLTALEYWVSQVSGSAVFLFIIAVLKTALIVNYFMHVYRLWREEEHA